MSYGYNEQLYNELTMGRGMSGGAGEPAQRLDFNFGDGMGGAFGGLAPMLMQPMINSMFGQGGFMPAQFSPTQGFYDQWRSKQYWQARQSALTTASAADRETYVQMLRGMAQMRGTPWGLEQQRSANVMAGDIAFMAPFLAQAMPETFDAMHGIRGSATVMSSFLHRAGLTGVDPVTGRTGITGDSAGILASDMHRRFFGVGADLSGWRGISAGRAGAMYDELQTRGLMGLSVGAMTRDEQLGALQGSATSRTDVVRLLQEHDPNKFAQLRDQARAGGLTGEAQIQAIATAPGLAAGAIAGLGQDQFGTALRQFDAQRVGNRLKEMSGAVAAMREIFGDLGKPNAPMKDLIEGLDKLTQGGLATMNPAELERTVRTTQVIARTSGMGMQAFMGLSAQGAGLAQQLGLDPRFGTLMSQSAAEFGAAYGQVGRGDVGGWGRGSRDEMMLLDQQRTARAAASPLANRWGAAIRMTEALGADAPGPMGALSRALRAGQTTFQWGKQQYSVNMTEGQLVGLAARSGISEEKAYLFLRGEAANQEPIAQNRLDLLVKGFQADEFRGVIAEQFQESSLALLHGGGIDNPQLAQTIAESQARALSAMPLEVRNNEAARAQYLADDIHKTLRAQGWSEAQIRRHAPAAQRRLAGAGGYGRAAQRAGTGPGSDPALGGMGLPKILDLINDRTAQREAFFRQETQAQVAMGTALGGLSTSEPLQRLMNEVINPSASIGDAVKKFLGGVDPATIRQQLAGIDPNKLGSVGAKQQLGIAMQEFLETTRQFEATRGQGTPAEQLARSREYTARTAAMRQGGATAHAQIRAELVAAGIVGDNATEAQVQTAAAQVLAGNKGSAELKRQIESLRTVGGMSDPAEIRRQQVAELAKAGVAEADISRALAGDAGIKGFTPEVRERVEAWAARGGGIDAKSAALGMHLGAKVGIADLEDIGQQRALLAKDLGGKDNDGDRRRHATAIIDRGRRRIDQLALDVDSVRNLGAGGGDMVMRTHENMKAMQAIADKHGIPLADIIGGTVKDEDKLPPAVRAELDKVRGLNQQVAKDEAKMAMQLGRDPAKRGKMTEVQEKAYAEWRDNYLRSDEAKNREVVTNVAKGLGLKAGSEDEITRAVKRLGEGPGAESRRDLVDRFKTTDQLRAMAAASGMTMDQLRGSGDPKVKAMIERAGGLSEGKTFATLESTVDQISQQHAAAAKEAGDKTATGAAAAGKMKLEGTVKIDMTNGTMDMSGSTGTNLGSTPVI